MGNQYLQLLDAFSGAKVNGDFNYSDPRFTVPIDLASRLMLVSDVGSADPQLVLYGNIHEVSNFTITPEGAETYVGDGRRGNSLVIGLNPHGTSDLAMKGRGLSGNGTSEAIVGDSIVQTMYSPNPRKGINLADPLAEGLQFGNGTFRIVGVSVDPINNGFVTYVPLDKLMNATQTSGPNMISVKLNCLIGHDTAVKDIRTAVKQIDSDLDVFDAGSVTARNIGFLDATWQTIMVLPFLSLASAAISLVGYMMLSVDEQRQEFGMLRAVGAKPGLILGICAIQGAIVLFSSFAVGLSLGFVSTLIILMAHPFVTAVSFATIAIWILLTLVIMYMLSLYPAYKLSKTSILRILA
jgi:ABC-type antimicrobial peptide transport system permease subunit